MLIVFCARVSVFTGNLRHKRSQIFDVGEAFELEHGWMVGQTERVTCVAGRFCHEDNMYSASLVRVEG